jgi:DNA-binding response OmpR family regulator
VKTSILPPAVLVVDDEADFLTTYHRLLGRHGFRVVPALSKAAALHALAHEPFVVAIVDLRLPDGDGLDIVRRAAEIAHPPPAIVVTGFASNATRAAALRAGAADFFAKPFEAAALTARVRELAHI